MKSALDKFREQWARISILDQSIAILSWDMETYMPEDGVKARSEQLALLSELAHQWLVSDETARLIEEAERESTGGGYFSDEVSMLRVARRTYDQKVKIPQKLISRLARTTTKANSIWVKARKKSNFSIFATVLAELIDINREQADLLGYTEHRYDALLDLYEPNVKTSDIDKLFKEMKLDLIPLVKEITGRKHAEDALRESEVRFSTIFHSSPVSIGISRVKDGQLLDVNDAWQKLLGFSREEAIGRNTIKLNAWVNPGDRGRLISRLSEDGTVENFEVQGRHKSGSLIDLLMFARLIDIAGEQYSLILSQDITEKKRLESQVQQRQKMETLGTLVAGVAHEINNPINTIMNNAPLLRGVWKDLLPLVEERAEKEPGCRYGGLTGGFLKENMDQLISDMDMAANRVASIVKGLKDFSRKTSPLEKQQVDINIAVENAIRLAGPTIRKSGITLALDLAPDLPAINANLQNLEQIIMNLAVNAVQAIDHDHGEIKIATTHNKNQGTIVLSVQDNGRGISTAISDKIFDPFFTEWQSIGGTGLGLPITQNLVKANDGEITFKSRMGKGTSFLVSFTVERKKKPFKILLVDDNEAVLEMVKQALTIERHYMVEQARGGNEALIKIGIYHPDLLILDIFMPQMDGVEVCREIQKHPELYDMKVIILTGYPEHDKVKEVAEMGFTNVVPKPLMDLREFMKEVDDLLMGKEEG